LKKIIALTRNEFLVFLREPMAGVFIILFPIIILVSSGIMNNGSDAILNILPVSIGLTILAAALLGITMNLAIYRENKVLKRFQMTKLSSRTILFAEFNVLYLFSIIGIICEIIIAIFLFRTKLRLNIEFFVLDIIICSIYFWSMGFFISAIIRTVKSVHAISSLLFTIMMIFNITPLGNDTVSVVVKMVSNILPLTHAKFLFDADLMSTLYNYRLYSYVYILFSVILFIIIGNKFFRWE